MSYIVDPADLSEIRRDLGPQPEEGLGFLVRLSPKVREGTGYKKESEVATLLPCRAQIVPYHRTKEELKAGTVGSALRYLIELPAFTLVRGDDLFDVAAPQWASGQFVDAGEMRMPTIPNGSVYRALAAGRTGNTEPAWSNTAPASDGGVAWGFARPYLRLEIVEIAQNDPYEITRNVWGDLKS